MQDREVIKHAAVISKSGMIFLGKCHADCFHQASNVNVKMTSAANKQGFFTSHGRFVGRMEAREIAVAAHQVPRSTGPLFSEELWSGKDGGRYVYDLIEGYV